MIKKILRIPLILIGAVVAAAVGFCVFLTITEYRPEPTEILEINGSASRELAAGDELTILTWNIGYCGLSYDTDFFLDGGEMVTPSSKELVQRNLNGVTRTLTDAKADVYFLQEIDKEGKRSYDVDQVATIEYSLGGNSVFATTYLCKFVPYPPKDMIGNVNSGTMTAGSYKFDSAKRISLPSSYGWPVRMFQPKRCLLVSRIPLSGSSKELVLINLHMDAYDNGEGKIAQTKILAQLMIDEYKNGNYVIAGGDFNQFFPGYDRNRYPFVHVEDYMPGTLSASMFTSDWSFMYDQSTPTYVLKNQPYDPTSLDTQYHVIDGFISSPNVECLSVETLNKGFYYSDHNPVMVKVKLAE